MLTVCWLYVDCMLTVCWLYVDCTLTLRLPKLPSTSEGLLTSRPRFAPKPLGAEPPGRPGSAEQGNRKHFQLRDGSSAQGWILRLPYCNRIHWHSPDVLTTLFPESVAAARRQSSDSKIHAHLPPGSGSFTSNANYSYRGPGPHKKWNWLYANSTHSTSNVCGVRTF